MVCNKCKVIVEGTRSICPLCHEILKNDLNNNNSSSSKDYYAIYAKQIFSLENKYFYLVFKSIFFAIVTICVFLNIFLIKTSLWSLLVFAGLFYFYRVVRSYTAPGKRISIKLFIQTIGLTFICLIVWILLYLNNTQWIWILEYVLPIVLTTSTVVYAILIFLQGNDIGRYIILYLTFIFILGFIPFFFALFGQSILLQKLPSFISFGLCMLLFIFCVVWQRKPLFYE